MKKSELKKLIKEVIEEKASQDRQNSMRKLEEDLAINVNNLKQYVKNNITEGVDVVIQKMENDLLKNPKDIQLKAMIEAKKFLRSYK